MRTSTLFAVTLLSALGLSLAAHADPTISLEWQSAGTADISVLPGTTVTAEVYLTLPFGESLDAYQLSIGWDSTELSYVVGSFDNAPPWPYACGFECNPLDPVIPGEGRIEGELFGAAAGSGYSPLYGPVTHLYIGSLSFAANPTDVGGPIDIWAYDTGTFGTDGFFYATGTYAYVTFNGASVNLIPEPAAASLLALGLAALAAARRRRRLNS